jgi:ABC-type multidrug transport system ATPase subunit/pSer/pThr/pTyr-binding forkhead associated (FHA) protein
VLEDLGSSNGTFVNGYRITSCQVDPQSLIALGGFQTALGQLLALAPQGGTVPTAPGPQRRSNPPEAEGPIQEFTVGSRMLTLGRDERSDIPILEPRVSAHHARVFRNAGRLILEDAGSANGTFVNGERIAWKILTAEDVVQVGSRRMRFTRPARTWPEAQPARIDVRNVSVDVVDRETRQPLRIVDDLSFTALPGELVALMGPSGSGKTTLLMALAGLSRPTLGTVELNRRSLYSTSGDFAPGFSALIGYAPQDDIVHDLLTVEEAVRYSAKLRCSSRVGSSELEQRVTRALQDVGLEHKRRTRIGSPTSKSLSGGQRKRVNIAMELVTDPTVLLLDEPTSGLSSKDAADLVDLLRRLADGGKTIILTLHQPSYPMFVQIDQLVLLEQGRLAYFGPTAIDSFDFFQVRDRQAGALLDEIPVEGVPVWPLRFRESDNYRRAVLARQELPIDPNTAGSPPPTRGALSALWVLLGRGLLLKARDKYFWIVAVLVPLVVALLFALVLGAQLGRDPCPTTEEHTRAGVEHSYLLVLTIMACFFGALSSSLEILRERAVLARERRSGLGLLPYLASKAWLFVIPALTHPLASLSVLELWGGALEGEFIRHYLVLVPGFFAAACAGLCISATVGSAEGVIGLSVSYAIIQTVFSVFAPLSVTVGQDAHHEFLRWAAAPTTARWTLSGLVAQSDLCRPSAKEGQEEEEREDERTSKDQQEATPVVASAEPATELKPDLPPGELTAPSSSQSSDPKHAPLLPELPAAKTPADPRLGARAGAMSLSPRGVGQCQPEDQCEQYACMKDQLFMERCQKNYYLDHGIPEAAKSSERTDPLHLVSSVLMNSLLALVALVGAGLLLRRKGS